MADLCRQIVESERFHAAILTLIILGAILIGLETSPEVVRYAGDLLNALDTAVLALFVVEAALKMGQYGWRFYRYFLDPWNVFDFVVVAVCFLPFDGQYAAVLRLARVFRALRLVTAVPQLQVLVNALLKSIPSMGYVLLLLVLLFYAYGVMGVFLFRDNDPVHFRNLPTSMLTLFTVITQEGWDNVLYIQMYGSNVHPFDNTTDVVAKPYAQPIVAPLFFVSFLFLGTMVLLNLFVGVIVSSMEEVSHAEKQEELAEAVAAIEEGEGTVSDELTALLGEVDILRARVERLGALIKSPS
ncbi:MAG: ion transporter [Lacipirellulaceae bacterium]